VKRMKTIAVAAGVTAAVTSLSVGAWAATGHSTPAAKKKPAASAAESGAKVAAAPAGRPQSDLQPKSSAASASGIVRPGTVFKVGKWVKSANGKYGLVLQSDGNLVLYQGKKALWSTVTGKHPGAFAAMQTDGNLVVYSRAKKALWASDTGKHSGAYLAVQDDGNLVIYSSAKKALWSRHMSLGNLRSGYVLSPGQGVRSFNGDYQLIQQTDGNLVMYRGKTPLWSSETGRHPGAYAAMQPDGNLVVYGKDKKALWYSNTANHKGAHLEVQNDGNLVIYSTGHKALWSRHMVIGSLRPGQKVTTGNEVRSPNGVYSLQPQTDGNLVLYKDGRTPVWSTGTKGAGVYALMQADGNFVLYQGTKPLWNSGTGGRPGAHLEVQDDGNVVVYQGTSPLWSSRK
jgi:hypothetical protein